MITAHTIDALRQSIRRWRDSGKRIAFVPTMGNLHAGHLALVRAARRHGDVVVVSIFVNPMQFDRADDLAAYPRTPEQDLQALASEKVDLVFLPEEQDMYPRPLKTMTFVEVPGLSDILCGADRPGHFRGVATVVNRLFNLVQPDVALFGKKDYQQCLIIRRMVSDLAIPVEIVADETVREADGLALSSRNKYLTAEERGIAPVLASTLKAAANTLVHSQKAVPFTEIEIESADALAKAGFRPDYFSIRRQHDLAPPESGDRDLVILAAAWLGKARLIDNIEVSLN
ncbi:MAG: pantoate--beta-alanine ligase [Acidiferrobacteraceae bacterium]|jgi:pantoate--beta-alanine ligase